MREEWLDGLSNDSLLFLTLRQISHILSTDAFLPPEWFREKDDNDYFFIGWPQHGVFVEIHDFGTSNITIEFAQILKHESKKKKFALFRDKIEGFFGNNKKFLLLLFPREDDLRYDSHRKLYYLIIIS